ncbi:MAG TPA: glycine--tRNA ligase subunit beta [Vicinamibacterales bacterium]|nr:glycine--tRNA ligase subunit beta [Vicinamibacterales bacterium]HPW20954.1 glycine--tRNA ligase subunit beta [Vicinamibacterales bacterium]
MDRELLIELGCEEIPASWLPPLTRQLGEAAKAGLEEARLETQAPIETFGTPRRLVVRIGRLAERQSDREDVLTGPPAAAAFNPDGSPSPAAAGFARKHGVEPDALERVTTGRGEYLAVRNRVRGKPAADVLPSVLAGILRALSCPKQMRWDARLDDGRGELLFGRPIRWIVFLYGGRVVPFVIGRSEAARSGLVQDVRSGALTYGHRFLATSGRAGRAIKVRSFQEYRAKLLENFVMLDREERHAKIIRELDAQARRLGGRVSAAAKKSRLLQEVPDLVEYPSVVAGAFATEFLQLPDEVLTTTMIHHQHFFPVVTDRGSLMPAFLAVVNTEPDDPRAIARNLERTLVARLRDARFFWDADCRTTLDDHLLRLETVLFHKQVGSYLAKARRLEALASWLAAEVLASPDAAAAAGLAGRLAKADLATDLVRELTELQGEMGGIYAREHGLPEAVWRAIYFHYLPVGVEPSAPPTRSDLGPASVTWAAVSVADKLDTVTALFAAGERPTGTRDPFGLRRQSHGLLRTLVDLPELAGLEVPIPFGRLLDRARAGVGDLPGGGGEPQAWRAAVSSFFLDRLRYLFEQRGFAYDEINAVLGRLTEVPDPLDARRRLEALKAVRGSSDFDALAVAFRRVKNLSRELQGPPTSAVDRLTEPAERALVAEVGARAAAIREAASSRRYEQAFRIASGFRPAVDAFFTDVFVMVDDEELRTQRLSLLRRLYDLLLELADISEIVPTAESQPQTES